MLLCVWTVTRGQIQYDQGDPFRLNPELYIANATDEYEVEERCKSELQPPDEDDLVALFEYRVWFDGFEFRETAAPNADPFTEDNCDSTDVGSGGTGSVLYITSSETCHDVLFTNDAGNPVVCLYYPEPSTGQFYNPENAEEEEIEATCQEELYRPEGNLVGLIFYDSLPDNGAAPGYFLLYTTLEDNNTYNDSCNDILNSGQVSLEPPGRPVIWIYESGTCHDVLFFANDSDNLSPNPVVCLYYPELSPVPGEGAVLSDGLLVTTFLMSSLSIIASSILLFTYIIFPSLQTLPSKVVMNLAVSFLLADITIIVQTSVALKHPDEVTIIDSIGLINFYFFFARWVWMALSGFEMCRTIHVGTQLRFDSDRKRLRILLFYILFGWSVPILPTIVMAVVHFERLEEDSGQVSLFGIGGFVITLVPVTIVISVNIAIVAYLTYVLYKAHQWQLKVTDAIHSHKRKTNFTRIFIIILSILGVSWFLLLLVYIDGVKRYEGVQVLYTLFNVSQPIFVCIAFVATKKIFRKYRSLLAGDPHDDTKVSTIQNRFRSRRLLSFLFTDKELAESLPKYRFGRSNRHNSKVSVTSISMLSRDSSTSLGVKQPPPSNGTCSPDKEDPGLTPISEELEPEDRKLDEESPTHITVDLKDSSM